MPLKKKTLGDVIEVCSNRPMKLRLPAKRKPAKVHTPEPAAKRGAVTKTMNLAAVTKTKVAKPQKQPHKEATAPAETSSEPQAGQNVNVETAMTNPPHMEATTPKKKTKSIQLQLQLRRSPRCSSKLRAHEPTTDDIPLKIAPNTANPAPTHDSNPKITPPTVTSKYPTRTLSSASLPPRSTHSAPYPSLTSSRASTDKESNAIDKDPIGEDSVDEDPAYDEVHVDEDPVDEDHHVEEDPHVDEDPLDEDPDDEGHHVIVDDEDIEAMVTDEPVEEPLSIRCKKSKATETADECEPGKKRKRRGVVSGAKIADLIHRLGTRIKVECTVEANGPVSVKICSMVTHQIGSSVREKVPMVASTYTEFDPKHWDIVGNYLSTHFFLPKDDTLLWEFITRTANSRYKDWKSDCCSHYLAHGEKTPKEFIHKKDEWKWLVQHFQEPGQQAISARMKDARLKKMNHHYGKTPFCIRALKHLEKGHKAPFVAAYEEVYSQEAESGPLVEQMCAEVKLLTHNHDHDSDDPDSVVSDYEALPTDKQLKIIYKVVGQKKGTQVSGVGGNIRRPPRPRGGASNHMLKEELLKAKEEAVRRNAVVEHRLKALEEMVRQGVGFAGHGCNVSDGASFDMGVS